MGVVIIITQLVAPISLNSIMSMMNGEDWWTGGPQMFGTKCNFKVINC